MKSSGQLCEKDEWDVIVMSGSYVMKVGKTYNPEPSEPIFTSIFQEYERVIVESLVTSFGLDFFIKDQHGGDVDTIHNVRQIGKDEKMTYKNAQNQKDYENRGQYNSGEYHHDKRYIDKNRKISQQKADGTLLDEYTEKTIARNGKSDLDHVISAKEIHDDRARVLSGMKGTDLANSEENLQATNPHTNRTKKADTMDNFLDKYGNEYTEQEKQRMRQKDAAARKSYEAKLAKAYYTSPKFAKDLTVAAGSVGVKMGMRQAVGFVFAELWFSIKEEFTKARDQDRVDLSDFFRAIGRGVKQGFQNAKEKYDELFSRFFSGAVSGALSSLTTTLCNIFFTTAKNVVRIIRQCYASLVEAAKILFINPAHYTFGQRMRAVIKIIATGASVVCGVIVSEAIGKTPIAAIPVLGDIVQTFCGTLVTGIMSCSLLYFFDKSEIMNKLVRTLDNIHSIETEIDYYRRQADYFEAYAAKLMEIDIDAFRKETALYSDIAISLENAATEQERTLILKNAIQSIGVSVPWAGCDSLNEFMNDSDTCLVFE